MLTLAIKLFHTDVKQLLKKLLPVGIVGLSFPEIQHALKSAFTTGKENHGCRGPVIDVPVIV